MLETYYCLPELTGLDHLLLIFPQLHEIQGARTTIRPTWAYLDFPEVARFFQTMTYEFRRIYSLLDKVKAPTGRPPVCHRFQFRFLVFYLLAGFTSLTDARTYLNQSKKWQELLAMPGTSYHGSTLSRFLTRIPERTWQEMEAKFVRKMLWRGVVDLQVLTLDTYPIISHINTTKALDVRKIGGKMMVEFLKTLDLSGLSPWFQSKKRSPFDPLTLLKIFIIQHLWGISSKKQAYELVTSNKHIQLTVFGTNQVYGYTSHSNFNRQIQEASSWPLVKTLLTEVLQRTAAIPLDQGEWDEWKGLLGNQHANLDPGAVINFCKSKHLTYLGRGGIILGDALTELPVLGWVKANAKVSRLTFLTLMQEAGDLLPATQRIDYLLADGEFGTETNADACEGWLGAKLVRHQKTEPHSRKKLPAEWCTLRISVERTISRLAKLPRMQRPPVTSTARVQSYIHSGLLTLQAIVIYSIKINQPEQCRSLKWLQRRKPN